MNFFESQDRVRKHTALLVALFVLAVVALIVMTNLLVMIVFGFIDNQQLRDGGTLFRQMDWRTFAAVSAGVAVVVLAGSLYKILALSGGGKVVAEALGGQLIPQDTQDPNQRKLLNVVQEMAIASGTPAPPVYVLADERGINAFAAGFSPRDAVIGITRGAIDHLSRDQLQGVIAHEFSHIFNGDMRLNLRLIGVLNGILILGILGYYLLYSTSFSRGRRSSGQGAAAMLALAIGLIVIGFAGTFFGGLIKAAVSRQREFLADASAVQFTRNPNGIAGALKRIGGIESGSKIANPAAPEVSHAFFAQGVSGFIQGLSATHPPLAERILRIDPQWDGKFDSSDRADADRDGQQAANSETMTRRPGAGEVAAGTALAHVMTAMDQIGNPRQETIDYARSLLSELPAAIKDAVREPHGARAVVYSLVLDEGQEVRARQLKQLQEHADVGVYALTRQLMPETGRLDVKYRLPVIDIAMPALKQLSLNQYKVFRGNLIELVEMDSSVDLLEWSLQKILFSHLDAQFFELAPTKARYSNPGQVRTEVELVLSVVVHAGAQIQSDMEQAFGAAVQVLGLSGLALLGKDQIKVSDLDLALGKLEQLKPLAKSRLLKACAASIWHDRRATPVEVELLRAFASVLDCPMPPAIA
ncbi:M48 family metallopeptidase [Stutzerimonas stutzeri]|uniref:M48 family metallopeptidase n=1 Tax=Stutzerimonas stutzeri TaxID=316 RepID=UPI0021090E4D|nr:M48 family metallopeptidase [Stutzerimonas stutzeri]MCQ4321996.1 M48 family metallopeptidase [Stutzerimonas stutzeri]